MSQLIYSPFGALNQLHQDLNRVFEDRFTTKEPASYDAGNWVPGVDIREEDEAFSVIADVPGVDPKDVEVTLDHNVLTIRGSRSTDSEQDEGGFKRRERISGSFIRQFTLPDTVDPDSITARANNGVLEIRIPKGKGNQPRSIAVES